MKRILFIVAIMFAAMQVSAKDVKTVVLTTSPEMHCANCENKIKKNIRFEDGIKDIQTDRENQTVTIQYDADKTSEANIISAFSKINYEAKVVNGKSSATTAKTEKSSATSTSQKSCCKNKANGTSCSKCAKKAAATTATAEKSCCSEKSSATSTTSEKSCCKNKANGTSCAKCAKKAAQKTAETK